MINTKTDYCIGIRLPQDVWKVVDEVSRQEYRTKNATIVLLLRNAIKSPKMESQCKRILELQQKVLAKIEQVANNGGIEHEAYDSSFDPDQLELFRVRGAE